MSSFNLAIIGSNNGTNMLTLIDAIKQKQLLATIAVVMSNRQDTLILSRAREHQLPALWLDCKALTREVADQQLTQQLLLYDIDLIVLIGYMKILSPAFVQQWAQKIINVHPSLLPAFAGMMDRQVHQAVLDAGVKETGCTVHFVTEMVDAGPIVVQKKCAVYPDDTVDSVRSRVQALEGTALIEAIQICKEERA